MGSHRSASGRPAPADLHPSWPAGGDVAVPTQRKWRTFGVAQNAAPVRSRPIPRLTVHSRPSVRDLPRPLVTASTDRAPAYAGVLDELLPAACHVTDRYGNNRVKADHGWLKARLRPVGGLKHLDTAAVIAAGRALLQDLGRGHYELEPPVAPELRLTIAFAEFA
jgi:DDE domain